MSENDQKFLIENKIIRFRPTTEADLDYVLAAENGVENSGYIFQWPRETHVSSFANPDFAHLVIEDLQSAKPVGYLILSGLQSSHHSAEFMRFVITEKGQGYGKAAMELVKKLAFEKLKVNRLWLDVVDHNTRAYNLYKSAGFVTEGTLREAYYKDGKYLTIVIMSVLRRDYKPNH